MLATASPFPLYFDADGLPLDNGEIFFGTANLNPETNPQAIYWDAAGTQPAAQPVTTMNGFVVRAGTPANIYIASDYSVTVRDRKGRIVYYAASSVEFANDLALQAQLVAYQALMASSAGAGALGYDPTVAYSSGIGQFLNNTYARTANEIAAGVTPTLYAFPEGDSRRYGSSTVAADNHLALEATGKVNGFFVGTLACTTTVTLGGNSTLSGFGYGSVLAPNGCDGITITNGGTIAGPAVCKNFRISGTATGAKSGITANMLAASGNRSTGREFNNIYIEGFQYAVNTIGLWNATFYKVFSYNNYNGFLFSERSIKTSLIDCADIKGAITGVGTQTSYQTLQVGAIRPENFAMVLCYSYGKDRALDITNCLLASASQCDFDNCQERAINIGTVNGGVFINDTWVNMNNASAVTAVNIVASGSPIYEKVSLERLNITNLAPFAGSCAIKAGNQQFGVEVKSCFIRDFADGVQFNANSNGICKHNTINVTARAILLDSLGSDYEVGPNYITAGTAMTFTGGRPPGLSYYASGQATCPVTGMTAGLNVVFNWVSSGKTVTLSNPSSANGTSNATTMTATGLPAEIRPTTGSNHYWPVRDNGAQQMGTVSVDSAGTLTYGANAAQILAGGGFTAAAGKGITSGSLTYQTL
jgi:hypothetical protein